MTKNEFAELCEKHLITPVIALDDEGIVAALKANDDTEVERLLRENF